MQTQNQHKKNQGRLSNHQAEVYFHNVDSRIEMLSLEDQVKMDYAKHFIKKLPLPDLEEGDIITLGPMAIKMLQYFIYCAILNYERASGSEKVK